MADPATHITFDYGQGGCIRMLFLPTIILGALGTLGGVAGAIQLLLGRTHESPVGSLLALVVGTAMLWLGLFGFTATARATIDVEARQVRLHRRSIFGARDRSVPLGDFSEVRIAVVSGGSSRGLTLRYVGVFLRGPKANVQFGRSLDPGEARALAERIRDLTGLALVAD